MCWLVSIVVSFQATCYSHSVIWFNKKSNVYNEKHYWQPFSFIWVLWTNFPSSGINTHFLQQLKNLRVACFYVEYTTIQDNLFIYLRKHSKHSKTPLSIACQNILFVFFPFFFFTFLFFEEIFLFTTKDWYDMWKRWKATSHSTYLPCSIMYEAL